MYFVIQYQSKDADHMSSMRGFRLVSVGKETRSEAEEIAATFSHNTEGKSNKFFVCEAIEEVQAKPTPYTAVPAEYIEV